MASVKLYQKAAEGLLVRFVSVPVLGFGDVRWSATEHRRHRTLCPLA